jgi:hypothetical protein
MFTGIEAFCLPEEVTWLIGYYTYPVIFRTAYFFNRFYCIGYMILLIIPVLSCSMMFRDDVSHSTYIRCHVLVSLLLICAI